MKIRIAMLALCAGIFSVGQANAALVTQTATFKSKGPVAITDEAVPMRLATLNITRSGIKHPNVKKGGTGKGGKQAISDQASAGNLTSYKNKSRTKTGNGKKSISDQGAAGGVISYKNKH